MVSHIVILTAPLLAFAASAEGLTLPQLEALATQGQSSEVLARARQVDPLVRTAAWNTLVEKAAVEELTRLARTEPEQALVTVDGWLDAYRHLESSPAVAEHRTTLVIAAFDACMRWGDGLACAKELIQRLKRGPLASKAVVGLAARLPPRERPSRLVLAAEVARREAGSAPCEADWLGEALVERVERTADADDDVTALVATCGPRLGKAPLARALDSDTNRRRLCPKLMSQPGFEGVQRKRCERTISERP